MSMFGMNQFGGGFNQSFPAFGTGFGGNTFGGSFNQFGNLGGFTGFGSNAGGNLGLGGFNGFPPQYNFVNAFGQNNNPFPYIYGTYGQATTPNNAVPTFPSYLLGPVNFMNYLQPVNTWLAMIGAGGVNIAGDGRNPFGGGAFNSIPSNIFGI